MLRADRRCMCASTWCAEQHDRCGSSGESTARWGKLGEVSGSVGGRIPNILRADTHQPSILQVLTSRMASEHLAHGRLFWLLLLLTRTPWEQEVEHPGFVFGYDPKGVRMCTPAAAGTIPLLGHDFSCFPGYDCSYQGRETAQQCGLSTPLLCGTTCRRTTSALHRSSVPSKERK